MFKAEMSVSTVARQVAAHHYTLSVFKLRRETNRSLKDRPEPIYNHCLAVLSKPFYVGKQVSDTVKLSRTVFMKYTAISFSHSQQIVLNA